MIDRTAKTVALGNAGPVSDEDRRGFTHLRQLLVKKWTCPAGTTITQPATIPVFYALPGYFVHEVKAVIIEAFDTSVTLGLTDDGGNWIAVGDLDEQSATADCESSEEANQVHGKYFLSADTIDLVVAGANITQGTIGIEVYFTDYGRFEPFDLE